VYQCITHQYSHHPHSQLECCIFFSKMLTKLLLISFIYRLPLTECFIAYPRFQFVCAGTKERRYIQLDQNQRESSDEGIIDTKDRTVTILERGPNHIIALKPPSVVCHHSGWTGSRSKLKRGEEPEIPMLQRVRDAIHDIDSQENRQVQMKRVNLIHRLDRGASGALLLAFADEDCTDCGDEQQNDEKGVTAELIEAMKSPESTKTYVALVRGEVGND